MEIKTIAVGSFEENCSVLAVEGKTWIVDPGAEAPRIIALVESFGLPPGGILLTHAHFDHIGAIPELQRKWPELPVFIHRNDAAVITHAFNQFPPEYPAIPQPANLRTDAWPDFVTAIETPGHTPGGVCFLVEGQRSKVEGHSDGGTLFSGDTLFAGSVGRTDFPGGSFAKLKESLNKLTALADDTIVIPGHGPKTTIGREKASNPYLT